MGDVRRPVLLDLFCGAGGCSVGYHRAGFDVVGVDLHPQPNYPFRFVQADALDYLREHGGRFDAIHASPPCQAYCTMNNRHGSAAPPRLPDTLALLAASGRQWVLENVAGAKSALAREWTVRLTGEMFGLRCHRARLFAASFFLMAPPQPKRQPAPAAVYGKLDGRRLWTRKDGSEHRAVRTLAEGRAALGIDWMEWDELREAVPPAFTEFVGRQLLAVVGRNDLLTPTEG
jgi:DNA (cytosine-5)-methyltransferase 1